MILALGVLGLLAALSIVNSEMPRWFAWPLALAAAAHGVWLARAESRRPLRELVWPSDGTPLLDGHLLEQVHLQWRGPLAFLRWRDDEGHQRDLSWWPDTLSLRMRRELRLAATGARDTRVDPSMAP